MLATRSLLASPRSFTMPAVGTAVVDVGTRTRRTASSTSYLAASARCRPRSRTDSLSTRCRPAPCVASIAASTALSQPLVGRVADRVGARRVAGVGAVLSSAMLAMVGVAPRLWIVFVLILVGGLGSAGYHPAAAVLARRVLPGPRPARDEPVRRRRHARHGGRTIVVLLIAAHAGLGFTPLVMIPGVVLGAVLWRFLPGESALTPAAQASASRELLARTRRSPRPPRPGSPASLPRRSSPVCRCRSPRPVASPAMPPRSASRSVSSRPAPPSEVSPSAGSSAASLPLRWHSEPSFRRRR